MSAGIFTMPAAAYHADPAPEPSLSNSVLRVLLTQTPRHAWMTHPRLNPFFEPGAGNGTFDIGSTAHALLLEGMSVAVIVDADDWRTKAAQQARDDARAAGKVPLLLKQHQAVTAMVDAAQAYVGESPLLRGVFERAKPEQVLVWREANVWCRARLDLLTDDRTLVLDYKTTTAPNPDTFIRSMVGYGYDTQSVFYPRGLAALGHRGARFVFLVQEAVPPFACYEVEPAESMRELANRKIDRGLRRWRECLTTNKWPAYPHGIHQAEAPVWALKEEESIA
jgi:hypothetical protein